MISNPASLPPPISEVDAVEVARAFAQSSEHVPWDEQALRVDRRHIEDRDVWTVIAMDAVEPGTPAWSYPDRQPVLYFVDATAGRLLGFQVGQSRTLFPPADSGSDGPSLSAAKTH